MKHFVFLFQNSVATMVLLFALSAAAQNKADRLGDLKPVAVINQNFAPRATRVTSKEGFVHPGIGFSADDLKRIQKMVREGYEPWATAFDQFRKLPQASKNYVLLNLDENGNPKYEEMADGNGQYEGRRDADAAFTQTLMWYITGDNDYADKALKIIRSWYASLKRKTGDKLTAGMSLQKICFAAEVLRYTPQSGWTDGDTEGFVRFLKIMQPSADCPTAFMNQGSIATMGYMSAAIFMDDKDSYAKAITRATVGRESRAPARDYSLKNQIQEVTNPATGKPVILLVEMGRDQGHAQGDVGALGCLARTALVQGTKANEEGDIMNDGSGVNLFQFLNHRLLGGAAATAKYNLGYDIAYPPNKGIYNRVSSDMRGQLPPVYELVYNYYRYDENIPDTDENLKYIRQVLDLQRPEVSSMDFFGSGTLLYTHEKAVLNPQSPKGAPVPIYAPDYEADTRDFGRIQAAPFAGSKGDQTGNIGKEDYSDSEGVRRIISGIKINFYDWYQNVDFGPLPVDKMVMRAGSGAAQGCKIDVILLDKVPGIDFKNVTEENLAAGEKIGVIQVPATGWWDNFVTFTGHLERKLSGKHSIALRFYGSNHVYHFQANVDWFKFVNYFADETNQAVQADKFVKGAARADDESVTLKNGSGILFKQMDFDSGIGWLRAGLASTSAGKIEIRKDRPGGKLLANYLISDTKGEFKEVRIKAETNAVVHGKNDVYLVYQGIGQLKLKTYRNLPLTQNFAPVTAGRISAVYKGDAVFGRGHASITATKDGTTVVFPQVEFKNGPKIIAFKIRSNRDAMLSLVNIDKSSRPTDEPFVSVPIPDTKGGWSTVYFDTDNSNKKVTGSQMIYMTLTGDNATVDFSEMQFDPIDTESVVEP
jgi:hypothetical protein